jgi:hypothetical protein
MNLPRGGKTKFKSAQLIPVMFATVKVIHHAGVGGARGGNSRKLRGTVGVQSGDAVAFSMQT